MPFFWGDGFDCYALPADALLGYWDSGALNFILGSGRFSGSRGAINSSTGVWLVKSSGSNDATHHIVCAFQQTAAISGTTLGLYFQLTDGTTNQCCIVFRSDGAILLTSATPTGTVLATYTGAVTAANTWYAFEFEVVINNTAGSFAVRKNGNTSNDFSAASLNTRPGTNSYANKLTIGVQSAISSQAIDDLLWRSDAASVPWVGDIRCYTRRPASDAAVQWTPSGSMALVTPVPPATTAASSAGIGRYYAFTASYTGTIGSVIITSTSASAANLKAAIYTYAAGVPTTVLGTSNVVTNPAAGTITFIFPSPVSVVQGTQYFFAWNCDATTGTLRNNASPPGGTGPFLSNTQSYATFPATNPTSLSNASPLSFTVNITPASGANAPMVSDDMQDATASYVYSANVNDTDQYTLTGTASVPTTVVGVTTRGLFQKSDAGTRNAVVQLKSGGTTVESANTALNTTWGWIARTDLTDPATGAAWTPGGVSTAQVGARVAA